jgi:hypothetical protein
MKNRIQVVSINVALLTGVIITSFIRASHPAIEKPISYTPKDQSIEQLFKGFSVFVKAKKYTTIPSESGSELPKFFERKVEISVSGDAFRIDKVDPAGAVREIETFDGEALETVVVENGKKVERSSRKAASPHDAVEFNIKNLSLIAVLSYLSDSATKITFLERTMRKEDKIEVKVGASSFIAYLDAARIVRKVEVGKYTVEYGDYRMLDGLQIPFVERVFVKGDLLYELAFTEMNLRAEFPEGFFSHIAL